LLLQKINNSNKKLVEVNNIVEEIANRKIDLLLTIGAGDIDRIVNLLKKQLNP
jgi:UDP-N-acetylmuramate-alanine ligase